MVRLTTRRTAEALETLKLCYGIHDWEHFKRCTGYKNTPVRLLSSLVKADDATVRRVYLYEIAYTKGELNL